MPAGTQTNSSSSKGSKSLFKRFREKLRRFGKSKLFGSTQHKNSSISLSDKRYDKNTHSGLASSTQLGVENPSDTIRQPNTLASPQASTEEAMRGVDVRDFAYPQPCSIFEAHSAPPVSEDILSSSVDVNTTSFIPDSSVPCPSASQEGCHTLQ